LRFGDLVNLWLYPEHWQRDGYQPGFGDRFCAARLHAEIGEALELC